MRICDISLENRPRERLKTNGLSVLSDAELLAIILQNGYYGENVIDISNRLIASYGLENLKNLSLTEITKIKGIGTAKACKLLAAFELSKRANAGKICEKVIHNASDIANHYMEKMKDYKKEHLVAVFLDSKNKIIKDEVISIGTLDSSLVHPREVFKEAIKNSAAGIILVHNHPSGDCGASDEDMRINEKLFEAGQILNIKILDHIIIGGNKFESIC
ncbi:MAG: DNA repair protein RadC [Candidatus Lokiarchaeota archaeon]|nr:DNA repair protein RadC [Candidatus Lokiarchaeota archaeon]